MKCIRILLCFLLLAVHDSCICEDNETDVTGPELSIGDKLPNFTVTMNDGSIVTTADLASTCSIVFFFHTSCPDCQKELPILQRLIEHPLASVRIIGISRSEGAESIQNYWEEHGLSLPFSAQKDAAVYQLFARSIVPRVYVVDRQLTIRALFTDNPIATYEELCDAVENAEKN